MVPNTMSATNPPITTTVAIAARRQIPVSFIAVNIIILLIQLWSIQAHLDPSSILPNLALPNTREKSPR